MRLEQLEQEGRKRELEYSRQEPADTDGIMADAGLGMWHMTMEEGKSFPAGDGGSRASLHPASRPPAAFTALPAARANH